jgi:hypothetical protein
LIEQETAAIDEQIEKLTKLRDSESDEATIRSLNQRILGLQGEKAGLFTQKLQLGADPNSFTDQFEAKITQMQERVGTIAQQSANAFESAWNNALSTTSTGLTNWVMGHATAGEALRSIYMGVVEGIIQEFVKMAVQWVAQHTFMAAISSIFHATEVGEHVAAESAKTGATAAGTSSRSGLRLGETIFHGIQVAIRTAVHIGGEIAMTAITIAQTAIRAGVALVEAIPHLIVAAFKAAKAVADIPYVGPVLAIAAMGAIIAAGMGLLNGGGGKKGYATGGYTGDGDPTEEAGVVHRREFVFSAPQTAAIGRSNLAALARGGTSAMRVSGFAAMNGSGGAQPQKPEVNVHVGVLNGRNELMEFLESAAGQAVIFDAVSKRKMDLGINT